MKVSLLYHTPLSILIYAIRKCYDSLDKSDSFFYDVSEVELKDNFFVLGEKDKELIVRLIDLEHLSPFEHLVYTFDIDGISRLCLIELTRHRIASYSVKSTRWCMRKDVKRKPLIEQIKVPPEIREKLDSVFDNYVKMIEKLIDDGHKVDDVKYLLPEGLQTSLVMTINARSLMNFFKLRLDRTAHYEIRKLARLMLYSIPTEHRFIFDHFLGSDLL